MSSSSNIRKLLVFLSCLASLVVLCAVTAFAEDYGNFRYTKSEDESYIIITGYNSDSETPETIDIPDAIDNIPVTTISDDAFKNNEAIGDVVFPDSVTDIGTAAFANCDNIKYVILGKGVKNIGASAFYECTNLESIYMFDEVETIGSIAFKDCSALKSVRLSEKLKTVDRGAFFNCTSLKNVTLPASVTEIGDYAFGVFQDGNVVSPENGFTLISSSDTAKKYASEAKVIIKNAETCEHDGEWSVVRVASDSYTGYEFRTCSRCGILEIKENHDIPPVDDTGAAVSISLIFVLIIAFCILTFFYVKKSHKRRDKAIEEYAKEHPEEAKKAREAEQARKEAKKAKKAAKKKK